MAEKMLKNVGDTVLDVVREWRARLSKFVDWEKLPILRFYDEDGNGVMCVKLRDLECAGLHSCKNCAYFDPADGWNLCDFIGSVTPDFCCSDWSGERIQDE